MADYGKISYCGLDCAACALRESVGCEGCKDMDEPFWGGVCEIRGCAMVKGLENCSYCAYFPCEVLLDISQDPDDGDDGERIDVLRSMKDERDDRKLRRFRRTIIGGAIGTVGGLLLGGIMTGGLEWFIALGGGDPHGIPQNPGTIWRSLALGAIIGIAMPWLIDFVKWYNK
jgi:hypothetical protein